MASSALKNLGNVEDITRVSSGSWMMKPGSKSSSWKLGIGGAWARRHVWIQGNAVHYGPKEKKSEKNVPLDEIKKVRVATLQEVATEKGPEKLAHLGFWLVANEKTILFCAESASDRDVWLRVLGAYLARRGDAAPGDDDDALRHNQPNSRATFVDTQSNFAHRTSSVISAAGSPQASAAPASSSPPNRPKSQSVISNFNSDEIDELIEEEEAIRELLQNKFKKELRVVEDANHAEYEAAVDAEAERAASERSSRAASAAREDDERKAHDAAKRQAMEHADRQAFVGKEHITRDAEINAEDNARKLIGKAKDDDYSIVKAEAARKQQQAQDELAARVTEARDLLRRTETLRRDELEQTAHDAAQGIFKSADESRAAAAAASAARLELARQAAMALQQSARDHFFVDEHSARVLLVDGEKADRLSTEQEATRSKNDALAKQLERVQDQSQRLVMEQRLQRSSLEDNEKTRRQQVASGEEDAIASLVAAHELELHIAHEKSNAARAKREAQLKASHEKARVKFASDESSGRQAIGKDDEATRRALRDQHRSGEASARAAEKARMDRERLAREKQLQALCTALGNGEFEARMALSRQQDEDHRKLLSQSVASAEGAEKTAALRIQKEAEAVEKKRRLQREAIETAEASARSGIQKDLTKAYVAFQTDAAASFKAAESKQKHRQQIQAQHTKAQQDFVASEAPARAQIAGDELKSRKEIIGDEMAAQEDALLRQQEREAREADSLRARHKSDRVALEQLAADEKISVHADYSSSIKSILLEHEHKVNALVAANLAKEAAERQKTLDAIGIELAHITAGAENGKASLIAEEEISRQLMIQLLADEGKSATQRWETRRQAVTKLSNIASAAAQGIVDAEASAFEILLEEFTSARQAILLSQREAAYHVRAAEMKRQAAREAELLAKEQAVLREKRLEQEEAFLFAQDGCWAHKPGSQSNKPGASKSLFAGRSWQKRYIWVAGDTFCYGAKKSSADQSVQLRTVRKVFVTTAQDAEKDGCPKEMRGAVFRIDTWDKYYLFACGNPKQRDLLVKFFQWRTEQNADDDAEGGDGGGSLELAESAVFDRSSVASSSVARRSLSPGSQHSNMSPSHRHHAQTTNNFAATYSAASEERASHSRRSQQLPTTRQAVVSVAAPTLEGEVLDDLVDESEAEWEGVVKLESRARQQLAEAFRSATAAIATTVAAQVPPPTAITEDSSQKEPVRKSSVPPQTVTTTPPAQVAPTDEGTRRSATTTATTAEPPGAHHRNSVILPAAPPPRPPAEDEAIALRRRMQQEMDEHRAAVMRGSWMHKPRSKKSTGILKGFGGLGSNAWNKRFVWVQAGGKRLCYGEQQGKIEKDVEIASIKSAHVVSGETMKSEGAPSNMWHAGWRLVAGDRTILFAAPDTATRRHFVEYLSPKAPIQETRQKSILNEEDVQEVAARSAIVNSRSGPQMDELDDEDGEYDDPFAEDEDYDDNGELETNTQQAESVGQGSEKGASLPPTPQARQHGKSVSAAAAGGSPHVRKQSMTKAEHHHRHVVLAKSKEPQIPLATLKSFVTHVDDGVILNKSDGLVGAALASGEGLILRKVGNIDERFIGKAARVMTAASRLRSGAARIVIPLHVEVETDSGTVVTIGPCEDGKANLLAVALIGGAGGNR